MKKLLWALLPVLFMVPGYASSSDLYVSTTGYVGIGTTAPIVSLDASQETDALALPSGTTTNRPTGANLTNGEIRYNTTIPAFETYIGGSWTSFSSSSSSGGAASSGRLQCGGANCSNSTGSSTLNYCPYKGNTKTTASQGNYTIPSGCLSATLSSMYVGGTGSTSAAASTLYYIYLWNTSGTWVLDAETTGHATDSSTGIEIMSGDNTKTLVGMIHTDASKHIMTGGKTSTAGDTNTVATWDNRQQTSTTCQFTTNRTTTSTTLAEINSENRCLFMSWADAAAFISEQTGSVSVTNGTITSKIYLDGNTSLVATSASIIQLVNGYYSIMVAPGLYVPTEGYHYTVLGGNTNSGNTATYYASLAQSVVTTQ